VIGVNKYTEPDERRRRNPSLRSDDAERSRRSPACGASGTTLVGALLDRLVAVAADERENILRDDRPAGRRSMGDIVERLKGLWGTYRERPVF
jgi:methylmalonyl-CoA mutase N-terminal domain/subunit